jgi:hypothetical protein
MPIYRFGSRYSRWDGTQQIGPLSADDLMRAMSDDLMQDGDVNRALQRLFRWGFQRPDGENVPGLQGLMQRLRDRRQEQLERYELQSMLSDIADRIEQIVETERQGSPSVSMRRNKTGRPKEILRPHAIRRERKPPGHPGSVGNGPGRPTREAKPLNRARARPESMTRRRTQTSRSFCRRWRTDGCNSSTLCRRIPRQPSEH